MLRLVLIVFFMHTKHASLEFCPFQGIYPHQQLHAASHEMPSANSLNISFSALSTPCFWIMSRTLRPCGRSSGKQKRASSLSHTEGRGSLHQVSSSPAFLLTGTVWAAFCEISTTSTDYQRKMEMHTYITKTKLPGPAFLKIIFALDSRAEAEEHYNHL